MDNEMWWREYADCETVRFSCTAEAIASAAPGLVYLATPYSKLVVLSDGSFDWNASCEASHRAAEASTIYSFLGVTVISPIAQAELMAFCRSETGNLRAAEKWALDAAFWAKWCRPLLDRCDAVVVPNIEGWSESEGIKHEVAVAVAQGKRVYFEGDL